ncbi:hypothetical protein BDV12DRAFT_198666 [Aspergillus spectabilis]
MPPNCELFAGSRDFGYCQLHRIHRQCDDGTACTHKCHERLEYRLRILVVEGDQCALISVQFSLSLGDFYFLNPEIDPNCTNLWLGEAYCVAPVGTITSYLGIL